MNQIIKYSCLFSIFALVGCSSSGSDGSSTPAANSTAELQGTWVSPCEPDASDGTSERFEIAITGSSMVTSNVGFFASTTCDGTAITRFNQNATFVIPGTVTELADGNAKHIDFIYSGGSVTATQPILDALASQGTDLQMQLAAQGITGDLNNLTLAEIERTQAEEYELYRIDTAADGSPILRIGDSDGTYDSSSVALRPIALDANVQFTKLP